MNLKNCRVLLTGAAGGIGHHVAIKLAQQGARLALLDLRHDALIELQTSIKETTGMDVDIASADLCCAEDRHNAYEQLRRSLGGIDLLINNAGIVDFHHFSDQSPEMIERIYQVNLIAPVQLTRELLPAMLEQGHGRIVNIGSTFGSIGFAYFSAYASSKFAMRGFSESLRRELNGSGVNVSYIAPRAVKTPANSDAVYQMAAATGMNMDEPEDIAQFIIQCLIKDKNTAYYGWPENFFIRINALLPKLVDIALHKQNQIMARFAAKA